MAVLRNIRGLLVLIGLTLNTIVWFIPIFILAIVKLVLPVPFSRPNSLPEVFHKAGTHLVSVSWGRVVGDGHAVYEAPFKVLSHETPGEKG